MSADVQVDYHNEHPDGAQNGSMELNTDGGTLTGTLTAATGDAVEITDGTVDGNNLSWKAAITQPMPITLEFSAVVDGDAISGDVKLGAFGNASFTGERA